MGATRLGGRYCSTSSGLPDSYSKVDQSMIELVLCIWTTLVSNPAWTWEILSSWIVSPSAPSGNLMNNPTRAGLNQHISSRFIQLTIRTSIGNCALIPFSSPNRSRKVTIEQLPFGATPKPKHTVEQFGMRLNA